jgi:hypothetical protein
MVDDLIEWPPTKEWLAQNEGNTRISGGRMAQKVNQIRYRNHFELIADHDVDALDRDYSAAFQHFEAARYAYLIDQKATAGWRADTSGAGSDGDLPLVDLYLALFRRFDEHAKHRRQHGIRDDHWTTLMMLARELPDKPDITRIRSAMYPLVPQIEAALEQLEEFIHEAQVAFKKNASRETV